MSFELREERKATACQACSLLFEAHSFLAISKLAYQHISILPIQLLMYSLAVVA